MSIARLKSLVIAVLLLINIFFATDIVWDRISDAAQQARTIGELRVVMESSGLALSVNAIGDVAVLDAYTTSQDAFAEAVIARAILGDCAPVQSESGQIYAGENGTATFNSSGRFIIEMTEAVFSAEASPERAARKLLKSMGINTAEPVASVFGNTTIVVALCSWRGSQIFNCTVSFTFVGGELVNITGRRPSGMSEAHSGDSISLPTALLSFLRFNKAQETEAGEITSIEPGYRMNVDAFGDGMLIPGWLIKTDAGDYFANASSGEIQRNDI